METNTPARKQLSQEEIYKKLKYAYKLLRYYAIAIAIVATLDFIISEFSEVLRLSKINYPGGYYTLGKFDFLITILVIALIIYSTAISYDKNHRSFVSSVFVPFFLMILTLTSIGILFTSGVDLNMTKIISFVALVIGGSFTFLVVIQNNSAIPAQLERSVKVPQQRTRVGTKPQTRTTIVKKADGTTVKRTQRVDPRKRGTAPGSRRRTRPQSGS